MGIIIDVYKGLISGSGIAGFTDIRQVVMLVLACVLLYLGIAKKFEPLLLVGIAFGMLLTNLPGSQMYHPELWSGMEMDFARVLGEGGLLDLLYIGVKLGLYPALIFLGVGAMTDFGPMIANPSSLFMGAAAQGGIFAAFALAVVLGFPGNVAASIGIIGGADGPTAIWLTKILAPDYLGPIAIAAYSYMALIPMIQPPLMRLLTTEKERSVKMDQLRSVSKTEKIVFPVMVTIAVILLLPSVAPLLGCLMLGNLWKECGVAGRLADTAQNHLFGGIGGGNGGVRPFPLGRYGQDHPAGAACLWLCNRLRAAVWQADVRRDPWKGQPADRLGRRFGGAHGRPRITA